MFKTFYNEYGLSLSILKNYQSTGHNPKDTLSHMPDIGNTERNEPCHLGCCFHVCQCSTKNASGCSDFPRPREPPVVTSIPRWDPEPLFTPPSSLPFLYPSLQCLYPVGCLNLSHSPSFWFCFGTLDHTSLLLCGSVSGFHGNSPSILHHAGYSSPNSYHPHW